jgi:C1A family cysteine protease
MVLFIGNAQEFVGSYLQSNPRLKKGKGEAHQAEVTQGTYQADWTGVYTTPVKDQGSCGSCWAFSAVEQIESDAIRTLGVSYLLSEQQVCACV